jgi:6,7-dimethyl-8-ribityllumazine synthase
MNTIEYSFGKVIFSVAIVVSRFNQNVTDLLCEAALERLNTLSFLKEYITLVKVPGAIEIPITAQRLAKTGLYEAIICLGSVIHGETDHYRYVCDQVNSGCLRVSLEQDIPLIFGVLTTENEEQALARARADGGNAGKAAVDSAVELVSVLRQIERQ